jgi:hypothetical protein
LSVGQKIAFIKFCGKKNYSFNCKIIILSPKSKQYMIALVIYIFLVKRVPGQGPEQRESEKTLLYLQINILISYIIIKLLINENHPGPNRE